MIITIDDGEEEKFFPEGIKPSIKPEKGLTLAEHCVIQTKYFFQQHRKPIPINIDWNERKQEILEKTPFPQSIIDLIANYEISATQKDFLNLKNWFQFYDHSNRFIRTSWFSLLFNLYFSSFIGLIMALAIQMLASVI